MGECIGGVGDVDLFLSLPDPLPSKRLTAQVIRDWHCLRRQERDLWP